VPARILAALAASLPVLHTKEDCPYGTATAVMGLALLPLASTLISAAKSFFAAVSKLAEEHAPLLDAQPMVVSPLVAETVVEVSVTPDTVVVPVVGAVVVVATVGAFTRRDTLLIQ
jgi:uncharacterized membrane protein (DUF441 family)